MDWGAQWSRAQSQGRRQKIFQGWGGGRKEDQKIAKNTEK